MATDEVLLNSGLDGIATLRFYQWREPTVSLGHFQTRQAVEVPSRFEGLPVVRRLSGGGAILHDRELTYSCVLPHWHPVSQDPGQLYDLIHQVVINVLHSRGVQCRLRGSDAFPDASFLCFSRGDARDIVIGSQKIVGSAQRRRQGTVLQHGSLLLSQSPWAPEFPGVQELAGVAIDADSLIPDLAGGIAAGLQLQLLPATLTPAEELAIERTLS